MQESIGFIYRITNRVNGKSYIGQTTKSVDLRWYEHRWMAAHDDSKQAIHRAIRKYGIESFFIEKVTECLSIYLDALEAFFIVQFSSHVSKHGYNMTSGGTGLGKGKEHPSFGKPLSEKHRSKIGKAHLGKKRSKETRQKQSIAATGRKHTAETRLKMTGRKLSESHVSKLKEAWLRRKSK